MPRILTATEEQILHDLRAGLLDAEIAVRLGIPIGDLKHRITVILRDFRLLSRDELFDWEPPALTHVEPITPSRTQPDHGGRAPILAAGVLSVVLLATLAVLVVSQPWQGEDKPVMPDVTPDIVAVPPALTVPFSGHEAGVDFGHTVDLQSGYALLLKSFDPEGRATGLDRAFLDPGTGEPVAEPLWRPPSGGRFTGVATAWDGARSATYIAITYEDADGSWLTTSADSGRTWNGALPIEESRGPVHTGAFGTVLSPPAVGLGSYQLLTPSAVVDLDPPPSARSARPAGVGAEGSVVWYAGDGNLVDEHGAWNLAFENEARTVDFISSVTWDDAAGRGVVVWRSGALIFTSRVGRGQPGETVAGYPGWLTGMAGPDLYTGNFCRWATDGEASRSPCIPVLYDSRTATVHKVNESRMYIDEFDPGTIVGGIPNFMAAP